MNNYSQIEIDFGIIFKSIFILIQYLKKLLFNYFAFGGILYRSFLNRTFTLQLPNGFRQFPGGVISYTEYEILFVYSPLSSHVTLSVYHLLEPTIVTNMRCTVFSEKNATRAKTLPTDNRVTGPGVYVGVCAAAKCERRDVHSSLRRRDAARRRRRCYYNVVSAGYPKIKSWV